MRRRRAFILLVVSIAATIAGVLTISTAASAPTGTRGEFSFSPSSAKHGAQLQVTGLCFWGGRPAQSLFVSVAFTVASANGSIYAFSKDFRPDAAGLVKGTVTAPDVAPVGNYLVTGTCNEADQVFFSKAGPFAVLGSPTATSTTVTSAFPTSTTLPPRPTDLPRTT